jgi:hypothetical protein
MSTAAKNASASGDVEIGREAVACPKCGHPAERVRWTRTPQPESFLDAATRPTEVVECASCEARHAAAAYLKGWGREPPLVAPSIRRADLVRERTQIRARVSRAADPEAWTAAAKAKRAAGRRDQGRREKDERFMIFRTKVWPQLEPLYGQDDWRVVGHRLCGANGIKVSDRQMDRLLEKGRTLGLVPHLR